MREDMRDTHDTGHDGSDMKWKGRWEQVRGRIKEKWGQLTDDEMDQFDGRKDMMVGKIHEKYGGMREDIEREWDRIWDERAA